MRLRRLWAWYREPFVTNIVYHEVTRIEYRQFPYKLKVTAVESFREKMARVAANGGGTVSVPDGIQFVTKTIDMATIAPSDIRGDLRVVNNTFRSFTHEPILRLTAATHPDDDLRPAD